MRFNTIILLSLAILLISVANVLILPPFEGFDEIAHYSSIKQIAETGTIPISGKSYLSQYVIDYRQHGPVPYSTLQPPFTLSDRMTYPEFFAKPDLFAAYIHKYRELPTGQAFSPSAEPNWEAMHPPLYYLMMAPLMKMMDSLPFVSQFLVLRLVSLVVALAGFVIALNGSLKHFKTEPMRKCVLSGFLFYPLIVPMFFLEFARLGNDSLCIFIIGIFWSVLLRWLENERNLKLPFYIGICLGLGLLTKGFFMPISFGFGLFLLFRLWQGRHDRELSIYRLYGVGLIVVPVILLAGYWYISRMLGSTSGGGDEYMALLHGGKWFEGLKENFSLLAFMRGIAAIIATWSWGGTWSLVRINDMLRIPVLLLAGWIFFEYIRAAIKHKFTDPIWLLLWLSVPFIGGLIMHVFLEISLGHGGTAGWYLSVLAPAFSVAFAYGFMRIYPYRAARIILPALLLYSIVFLVITFWAQMAMFAGCAKKGVDKYYEFSGNYFCLDHLTDVMQHLDVIAWAIPGLLAFAAGILCYIIGLISLTSSAIPEKS